MRFFLRYLRGRLCVIAIFTAFFAVFLLSFALYRLPLRAVLYPSGLCALLGMILGIADFLRARRRHVLLLRIRSLSDMALGSLPPAASALEADYQQILRLFDEEHCASLAASQRRYEDMVDYYTVWVHQIKTPITSMRLHLQNEDTPLSRTLSDDLLRVEQYVEMVLVFLRLNAQSTDYVFKPHDLDAIVRQAVKKYAGEFINRCLRLAYEPIHATVVTDEKWLSFVIEQVLSNALKYTSSGSITITLEPEKKLVIRDTGLGIAPEDLPRIFENGFTGYNGRLDKKASGIGLYLCRQICRRLGHTISAQSTVGEGTRIVIDLEQTSIEAE